LGLSGHRTFSVFVTKRPKAPTTSISWELTLNSGEVAIRIRNLSFALASNSKDKLRIRIATSPEFKVNSHEIEVIGAFGRLVTRTENVVCPDNPKTSFLAVLSAVRTLKEYFQGVRIGT